jgi:hypothetical protein
MDPDQSSDQGSLSSKPIPRLQSVSTYLHGLFCERLVVLNAALTLRRCLTTQEVLRPNENGPRLRVHDDRTLDISYASSEALKTSTQAKFHTYAELYGRARQYKSIDEFKQALAGLADSVARIQHNGGQVVFLRLPASGARLELEETAFPSSIYFGALASATDAHWIDFRDLASDGGFDCPDESHLSLQGARIFTKRLVERLRVCASLAEQPNAVGRLE